MRVSSPQPYLDIHTTNAVVTVQHEPVRLTARHQRAQMRVSRTPPTFKVTRKQLQQNSIATSDAEIQRQNAAQRRRQILRRSSDSIAQGDPVNPGKLNVADLVASVTIHRSTALHVTDKGSGTSGQSIAKIDWDPGSLEIEWDPYKLEMSWEGDMRPKITVTPHTVEIRLINGETIRVGENEAHALEMQGYGKRVNEEV